MAGDVTPKDKGSARVHGGEAIADGGVAVKAHVGQAQVLQQPLRHVQDAGPLAEDEGREPASLSAGSSVASR